MADSPIANEFNRPPGWRFEFGGVNLREAPDAIVPPKFSSAKNIRATAERAVQTRPGYVPVFATPSPVTDISAYAAIQTDDLPRLLARCNTDLVYDDNGNLVTTLAGNIGGGVWMLPFRPGESPQSWMYVAGLGDYQKISPPGSTTAIGYQVGIAEPNSAVDAQPCFPNFDYLAPTLAANFVAGGTAGGLSDSPRVADTVGVALVDTGLDPTYTRYACQVSATNQYQIGENVSIGGGPGTIIQDVVPPIVTGKIVAIYYYSGSTGLCVVVPTQAPYGIEATQETLLGALRRGALVQLGSEIVMVLNATEGPSGTLCFECSTTGTHVVGETLTGIPSIVLAYASNPAGQSVTANQVSTSVAAGLGYISRSNPFNPFVQVISSIGRQEDQYFVFGFTVSDPTQINEIRLEFNVDVTENSGPSYLKNYYYYSIQPSLIAGAAALQQTQLQAALTTLVQTTLPDGTPIPDQTSAGFTQWTELYIPLDSLIRVGGDAASSLSTLNGFRIVVNVNSAVTFSFADIYTTLNGEPDTGDDGTGFQYRIVPRNSQTGVKGNASPPMRYSIKSRRQLNYVSIPSSAYDGQIDIWDIYRYGGTDTSYRFVGTTPAFDNTSTYVDNADNAATEGGALLEIDNFQPWPSIGLPLKIVAGGAVTITVTGTACVVSGYTSWPSNILNWLPGTLINIGGQNAFTLRSRPVQINSTTYRFDLQECAGIGFLSTPFFFWVLEPKIANSPNPYIFGPDATGTFFGVGDQYRPGTVSFSKAGFPDSVPDKYNLDLCPPSEPLLGGVIKGGVSLVGSTERWWALYPSFGSPTQRYSPIEQSVGRGIAAPYGIDTDGVLVYFWAKDCIAVTAGGPFESLTSDLYQLFPHEGVPGVNITRYGLTYYAPDYSRASSFRLRKIKNYLFADYFDSTGTPRTLICDLRTKGWAQDVYSDPIAVHYSVRQQSGTLTSSNNATYPSLYMGDANGKIWKEQDCAGDNGNKIPCHIATPEWNGGDERMQPLWGDMYLDAVPNSNLTVTPISLGNNAAAATIITATGNRTFAPISVAGGELNKFMGLLVEWTE